MEDPIWESVSEDLNFDLRLENQLRIPTEGSAACRKPRCERTRGQLSSTHRKKVGPPSLARRGPPVSFVFRYCSGSIPGQCIGSQRLTFAMA